MARRLPREGSGLQRRPPRREPYDRVLIVCEGEKTEPNYFSDLKDHYRLSNANIAVTRADGTDPLSIVRTAKNLQAKEHRQGDRYDRVYCVFDRDRHADSNFQTACDQIKQSGFTAPAPGPVSSTGYCSISDIRALHSPKAGITAPAITASGC